MLSIHREHLLELCQILMAGHIKYEMDDPKNFTGKGKIPLRIPPKDVKGGVDCSGFVRYLIFHATDGKVTIPDGSWNQNDWCRKRKLPSRKYGQVGGLSDGKLRIAFLPPLAGRAGHVWLVMDGRTIESYSGKGPGRRPWTNPTLMKGARDCYELANLYSIKLGTPQISVGTK